MRFRPLPTVTQAAARRICDGLASRELLDATEELAASAQASLASRNVVEDAKADQRVLQAKARHAKARAWVMRRQGT